MPNWCHCSLRISGKSSEQERFVQNLSPNNQQITTKSFLEVYLPMPSEEEMLTQLETLEADMDAKARMEESTSPTWYRWCCACLGTKWPESYSGDEDEYAHVEVLERTTRLSFMTAWSPPGSGILTISMQFPSLTFTLRGSDVLAGFKSRLVVKNGKVIEDVVKDWTPAWR
ncbi:MAG: hypothetical protein AB9869_35080 [Verrucomicrobiia bacterium]